MNYLPRLPLQPQSAATVNGAGVSFERRFSLKMINPDVPLDIGIDELDSENYYPSLSSLVLRTFSPKDGSCDAVRPSSTTIQNVEFQVSYGKSGPGWNSYERNAILPPSSPDVTSQFNNFSFETRSSMAAPPKMPPAPRAEPRYYSEVDIETNPNIFKHQYLIIRNDFLIGKRHLRAGENGYCTLSSLDAIKARCFHFHATDDSLRRTYLNFSDFSIKEGWDSPLLRQRNFFNANATLIFVERVGQYTKSGDPLFEFIGNFYVRRMDAVLVDGGMLAREAHVADAIPRVGSMKNALVATGPREDSLVLLQFVREANLI